MTVASGTAQRSQSASPVVTDDLDFLRHPDSMRQQGGNQTSCKIIVAAEDYIRCKLFQAPDDLLRLAVAFFHSQCGEWFPRLFKCLFQSVEFFPARIGENAFIMERRQINPFLAALFQKMFRRQKGSRRMVNEDIGIFDSRRRAEYRGNQRAEPGFGKRVVCRRDDQPVDSLAEQVPDCRSAASLLMP